MISSLKRLPGNTLELEVTVPWADIKTTYERIFAELLKKIELPGFRTGKAPRETAAKHIDQAKVYEEVLKDKVPKLYADVVREQQIKPIISPKVEVLEAASEKDWKLKITTCEKPAIDLGNYTQEIAKVKTAKQRKIVLPGQKEDGKDKEVTLGEILEAVYKTVKVEVSPLLVETETNRLLSNLLNELQKLGLNVDDYLKAQGKTSETLRQEYEEQARKTLALEFALEEIAEKEHVTIENSEIDEFINKAKTDAEKAELAKNRYYLGSLLRRQKTLTQLTKTSVITTA